MLPSIQVAGFTVTEPATMITDALIAGFAWVWARQLWGRQPASRVWALAFLYLGLAAFLGGFYHGFHPYWSAGQAAWVWRLTLLASLLSSAYLLPAGRGQFGPAYSGAWAKAALAKLVLAGTVAWLYPHFIVVLADFVLAMALVAWAAYRRREAQPTEMRFFFSGLACFGLGALIQAAQLAPHAWFNHNDLFHVVQLTGNYCFYRCARTMLKRPA